MSVMLKIGLAHYIFGTVRFAFIIIFLLTSSIIWIAFLKSNLNFESFFFLWSNEFRIVWEI